MDEAAEVFESELESTSAHVESESLGTTSESTMAVWCGTVSWCGAVWFEPASERVGTSESADFR